MHVHVHVLWMHCSYKRTRELVICYVQYLQYAFLQVLGSNFKVEYDANQAKEKQRKKDVYSAIKIGLEEYKVACMSRNVSEVNET
jgi:hypothetical protein